MGTIHEWMGFSSISKKLPGIAYFSMQIGFLLRSCGSFDSIRDEHVFGPPVKWIANRWKHDDDDRWHGNMDVWDLKKIRRHFEEVWNLVFETTSSLGRGCSVIEASGNCRGVPSISSNSCGRATLQDENAFGILLQWFPTLINCSLLVPRKLAHIVCSPIIKTNRSHYLRNSTWLWKAHTPMHPNRCKEALDIS